MPFRCVLIVAGPLMPTGQVHDDSIRSMSYSHNGQALISTDKLGWIKYFTPHLTNIQNIKGHREACHGVSWSPNDERFVTGGDDGFVKVWDYRAVKEEKTLTGEQECLYRGPRDSSSSLLARSRMGCPLRRLAPDQGLDRIG